MIDRAIPPALRSRRELRRHTRGHALVPPSLPLEPRGVTYTMAQEATWIDEEHFAIGRWDGSLAIFSFTESPTQGPLISCALNTPAEEGVQMIAPLSANTFASSNDDASIAIWTTQATPRWSDAAVTQVLRYERGYGAANSAVALGPSSSGHHFVAGHAEGYVTIWTRSDETTPWKQVTAVDIRSSRPVNPWGIHNIRGIDIVDGSSNSQRVVTGSEDGDLVILGVPTGEILGRTCYNPGAERGINSLAIRDDVLLVANCAVGPKDCNLWAYRIDKPSNEIETCDAKNLALNPSALQVFNFDVTWGAIGKDRPAFFASTEEGVLWLGELAHDGTLIVMGHMPVTRSTGANEVLHLGSALCYSKDRLVVANYDISEFATSAAGGGSAPA